MFHLEKYLHRLLQLPVLLLEYTLARGGIIVLINTHKLVQHLLQPRQVALKHRQTITLDQLPQEALEHGVGESSAR